MSSFLCLTARLVGWKGPHSTSGLGFQRGRDPLVSLTQGCVVAEGIPFSAQYKVAGRKSPTTLQDFMRKSWRSTKRRKKPAFSWAQSKGSGKKGVLPAEENIGQFIWAILSYLFFPCLDSYTSDNTKTCCLKPMGSIKGFFLIINPLHWQPAGLTEKKNTNSAKDFYMHGIYQ